MTSFHTTMSKKSPGRKTLAHKA